MVGGNASRPRRQRAFAVAFILLLHAVGSAPRVLLYGAAVLPSTLLRALLLVVELVILIAFTARPLAPSMTRWLGAALLVAACLAMTLLEHYLEWLLPGTIHPPVLYPRPPSFALAFVSTLTEAILRVALWTLAYVLPLKLDAASRDGAETLHLERERALSRVRASIEPAWVQRSLEGISARIGVDPSGARERIAEFAESLDERLAAPPHETKDGTDAEPRPAGARAAVPTPSLGAPRARRHFAVAVLAVASLMALGALTRFGEHGWVALPLEAVESLRIVTEVAVFMIIAERAARRDLPMTRTLAWTGLASVLVGLSFAWMNMALEARFPGLLQPPAIFTHPTPPVRQLVRALTTAAIHVGFWTLVYLYPLASAEAEERAARAANLRREVERARLSVLLAPHFVRNALNVIAGLATADPERAQTLLRHLGGLLSELARDEEHHAMERELQWLRAYTALFEARHPELLSFHFELDPRATAVVVPRLLLQPLVENAVLHGALGRPGGGRVCIRIRLEDASDGPPRVICMVEDDGPGMRQPGREGALGVRLVRERLAARAEGGRLSHRSSEAGTVAVVEIPLEPRS